MSSAGARSRVGARARDRHSAYTHERAEERASAFGLCVLGTQGSGVVRVETLELRSVQGSERPTDIHRCCSAFVGAVRGYNNCLALLLVALIGVHPLLTTRAAAAHGDVGLRRDP